MGWDSWGKKDTDKTYVDSRGYRRFRDTDRLVHRWMAEKKIGRRLGPNEVVHHKDGNPRNNDPDNLEVMSWDEHADLHEELRPGWKARHSSGMLSSTDSCSGTAIVIMLCLVIIPMICWLAIRAV
jgi:hypothetical protein